MQPVLPCAHSTYRQTGGARQVCATAMGKGSGPWGWGGHAGGLARRPCSGEWCFCADTAAAPWAQTPSLPLLVCPGLALDATLSLMSWGAGCSCPHLPGWVPSCSLTSLRGLSGNSWWESRSPPCIPVAREAGKTLATLPDSFGEKSPKLSKGVQRFRGSQREQTWSGHCPVDIHAWPNPHLVWPCL